MRFTASEAAAMTESCDIDSRIAAIARRKRAQFDQAIQEAASWGRGEICLLWAAPAKQKRVGEYRILGHEDGVDMYTPEMARAVVDSLRKDRYTVSEIDGLHLVVSWCRSRDTDEVIRKAAAAAFQDPVDRT